MATYSNTSFLLLRGPHVRVPTPPSKFATLFPFTAHLAGAVFWHSVVVTHGEFFTGGPTGGGGWKHIPGGCQPKLAASRTPSCGVLPFEASVLKQLNQPGSSKSKRGAFWVSPRDQIWRPIHFKVVANPAHTLRRFWTSWCALPIMLLSLL